MVACSQGRQPPPRDRNVQDLLNNPLRSALLRDHLDHLSSRFLVFCKPPTFRPTSSPSPTVLVGRYHVKKHLTITSHIHSHVCHNGALFSARLEPTGCIMSASEVRSRTLAVNMSRMWELCAGSARTGVNSQQKRRSDFDS